MKGETSNHTDWYSKGIIELPTIQSLDWLAPLCFVPLSCLYEARSEIWHVVDWNIVAFGNNLSTLGFSNHDLTICGFPSLKKCWCSKNDELWWNYVGYSIIVWCKHIGILVICRLVLTWMDIIRHHHYLTSHHRLSSRVWGTGREVAEVTSSQVIGDTTVELTVMAPQSSSPPPPLQRPPSKQLLL